MALHYLFNTGLHATIEYAPAQPFQGSLLERAGQKTLKHRVITISENRNLYTDVYNKSWKTFLHAYHAKVILIILKNIRTFLPS